MLSIETVLHSNEGRNHQQNLISAICAEANTERLNVNEKKDKRSRRRTWMYRLISISIITISMSVPVSKMNSVFPRLRQKKLCYFSRLKKFQPKLKQLYATFLKLLVLGQLLLFWHGNCVFACLRMGLIAYVSWVCISFYSKDFNYSASWHRINSQSMLQFI